MQPLTDMLHIHFRNLENGDEQKQKEVTTFTFLCAQRSLL